MPFDRQGLDDLDVGVTEFLAPLRLPASTAEFFTAIAGFASGAEPAVVSAIQLLEWIAAFGNSAYLLLPRHGTSLSTTPRA